MKDTDELKEIYRERFGGREAYREKVWSALIRDYFQSYVRAGDTVLDLGAGYGEFINQIHCGVKYAMDLNPDTAGRVSAGVKLIAQDCTEPWQLPSESLDVIFTSNFFEHLPDEESLSRTLAEAKRCLKRGGKLIAMGPNITYCGDAYWSVVDHHLPLSEQSLSVALEREGFRIEKCIAKFMPFTMSEGPQYPVFFVALYLRFPLAWRVFGKQFLVVAKKHR